MEKIKSKELINTNISDLCKKFHAKFVQSSTKVFVKKNRSLAFHKPNSFIKTTEGLHFFSNKFNSYPLAFFNKAKKSNLRVLNSGSQPNQELLKRVKHVQKLSKKQTSLAKKLVFLHVFLTKCFYWRTLKQINSHKNRPILLSNKQLIPVLKCNSEPSINYQFTRSIHKNKLTHHKKDISFQVCSLQLIKDKFLEKKLKFGFAISYPFIRGGIEGMSLSNLFFLNLTTLLKKKSWFFSIKNSSPKSDQGFLGLWGLAPKSPKALVEALLKNKIPEVQYFNSIILSPSAEAEETKKLLNINRLCLDRPMPLKTNIINLFKKWFQTPYGDNGKKILNYITKPLLKNMKCSSATQFNFLKKRNPLTFKRLRLNCNDILCLKDKTNLQLTKKVIKKNYLFSYAKSLLFFSKVSKKRRNFQKKFLKMPHRKPFFCYWLLPFIGLATLIPNSKMDLNLANFLPFTIEKKGIILNNLNNDSLAIKDIQQNLLEKDYSNLNKRDGFWGPFSFANHKAIIEPLNPLFKPKGQFYNTSEHYLNKILNYTENTASQNWIQNKCCFYAEKLNETLDENKNSKFKRTKLSKLSNNLLHNHLVQRHSFEWYWYNLRPYLKSNPLSIQLGKGLVIPSYLSIGISTPTQKDLKENKNTIVGLEVEVPTQNNHISFNPISIQVCKRFSCVKLKSNLFNYSKPHQSIKAKRGASNIYGAKPHCFAAQIKMTQKNFPNKIAPLVNAKNGPFPILSPSEFPTLSYQRASLLLENMVKKQILENDIRFLKWGSATQFSPNQGKTLRISLNYKLQKINASIQKNKNKVKPFFLNYINVNNQRNKTPLGLPFPSQKKRYQCFALITKHEKKKSFSLFYQNQQPLLSAYAPPRVGRKLKGCLKNCFTKVRFFKKKNSRDSKADKSKKLSIKRVMPSKIILEKTIIDKEKNSKVRVLRLATKTKNTQYLHSLLNQLAIFRHIIAFKLPLIPHNLYNYSTRKNTEKLKKFYYTTFFKKPVTFFAKQKNKHKKLAFCFSLATKTAQKKNKIKSSKKLSFLNNGFLTQSGEMQKNIDHNGIGDLLILQLPPFSYSPLPTSSPPFGGGRESNVLIGVKKANFALKGQGFALKSSDLASANTLNTIFLSLKKSLDQIYTSSCLLNKQKTSDPSQYTQSTSPPKGRKTNKTKTLSQRQNSLEKYLNSRVYFEDKKSKDQINLFSENKKNKKKYIEEKYITWLKKEFCFMLNFGKKTQLTKKNEKNQAYKTWSKLGNAKNKKTNSINLLKTYFPKKFLSQNSLYQGKALQGQKPNLYGFWGPFSFANPKAMIDKQKRGKDLTSYNSMETLNNISSANNDVFFLKQLANQGEAYLKIGAFNLSKDRGEAPKPQKTLNSYNILRQQKAIPKISTMQHPILISGFTNQQLVAPVFSHRPPLVENIEKRGPGSVLNDLLKQPLTPLYKELTNKEIKTTLNSPNAKYIMSSLFSNPFSSKPDNNALFNGEKDQFFISSTLNVKKPLTPLLSPMQRIEKVKGVNEILHLSIDNFCNTKSLSIVKNIMNKNNHLARLDERKETAKTNRGNDKQALAETSQKGFIFASLKKSLLFPLDLTIQTKKAFLTNIKKKKYCLSANCFLEGVACGKWKDIFNIASIKKVKGVLFNTNSFTPYSSINLEDHIDKEPLYGKAILTNANQHFFYNLNKPVFSLAPLIPNGLEPGMVKMRSLPQRGKERCVQRCIKRKKQTVFSKALFDVNNLLIHKTTSVAKAQFFFKKTPLVYGAQPLRKEKNQKVNPYSGFALDQLSLSKPYLFYRTKPHRVDKLFRNLMSQPLSFFNSPFPHNKKSKSILKTLSCRLKRHYKFTFLNHGEAINKLNSYKRKPVSQPYPLPQSGKGEVKSKIKKNKEANLLLNNRFYPDFFSSPLGFSLQKVPPPGGVVFPIKNLDKKEKVVVLTPPFPPLNLSIDRVASLFFSPLFRGGNRREEGKCAIKKVQFIFNLRKVIIAPKTYGFAISLAHLQGSDKRRENSPFVASSNTYKKKQTQSNPITKYKNLQRKRRALKQRRETGRLLKRKRFYPRPVWLRFTLYKKFLKYRHIKKAHQSVAKQKNNFFQASPAPHTKDLLFSKINFTRKLNLLWPCNTLKSNRNPIYPSVTLSRNKTTIGLRPTGFFDLDMAMPNPSNSQTLNTSIFYTKNSQRAALLTPPMQRINKGGLAKCKIQAPSLTFFPPFGLLSKESEGLQRIGNSIIAPTTAFLNNSTEGVKFQLINNPSICIAIFNEKDFYSISKSVLTDFKKGLWKSSWLRSNLNAYLSKIKHSLTLIKKTSLNWELDFLTKAISVQPLLGLGLNSFNLSKDIMTNPKNANKAAFWYLNFKNNKKTHSQAKPNSTEYRGLTTGPLAINLGKWETALQISEYNQITYDRIQKIITNIKQNFGSGSQAITKSEQTQPRAWNNGRQKIKKPILSPKGATLFSYANKVMQTPSAIISNKEHPFLTIQAFGNISKKRVYWALKKTNMWHYKNMNKKQYLWANQKLREQNRSNKTKKILNNLMTLINELIQDKYKLTTSHLSPLLVVDKKTDIKKLIKSYNIFLKKQKQKENKIGSLGFLESNSLISFLFSYNFKSNSAPIPPLGGKGLTALITSAKKPLLKSDKEQHGDAINVAKETILNCKRNSFISSKNGMLKEHKFFLRYLKFTLRVSDKKDKMLRISNYSSYTNLYNMEKKAASFLRGKSYIKPLFSSADFPRDNKSNYFLKGTLQKKAKKRFLGKNTSTQYLAHLNLNSHVLENLAFIGLTFNSFATMQNIKTLTYHIFVLCIIVFHLCSLFSLSSISQIRCVIKFIILLSLKISYLYLGVTRSIFISFLKIKGLYAGSTKLNGNLQPLNLSKDRGYPSPPFSIHCIGLLRKEKGRKREEGKRVSYAKGSLPKTYTFDKKAQFLIKLMGQSPISRSLNTFLPDFFNPKGVNTTLNYLQSNNNNKNLWNQAPCPPLFMRCMRGGYSEERVEKKRLIRLGKPQLPQPANTLLFSINETHLYKKNNKEKESFLLKKQNYGPLFLKGASPQKAIKKMVMPLLKKDKKIKTKGDLSLATSYACLPSFLFLMMRCAQRCLPLRGKQCFAFKPLGLTSLGLSGRKRLTLFHLWGKAPWYRQKKGQKISIKPYLVNASPAILILLSSAKFCSLELLNTLLKLGVKFGLNFYSFLFKMADIPKNGIQSIYLFLEKPGELLSDWITHLFLIEIASDLTTTIPENTDSSIWNSFTKFAKASSFRITPVIGTLLEKRLLSCFECFIEILSQPDTDLIVRQEKGKIFWDIWGEVLKGLAEENNINITLLTNKKDDQSFLLSKLLEDNPINSRTLTLSLSNTNKNKKSLKDNFFMIRVRAPKYMTSSTTNSMHSIRDISAVTPFGLIRTGWPNKLISKSLVLPNTSVFYLVSRPFIFFKEYSPSPYSPPLGGKVLAPIFFIKGLKQEGADYPSGDNGFGINPFSLPPSSPFFPPLAPPPKGGGKGKGKQRINKGGEEVGGAKGLLPKTIKQSPHLFPTNQEGGKGRKRRGKKISGANQKEKGPITNTSFSPQGAGRRWSANQFITYKGKDSDLFIQAPPAPKSFKNLKTIKHYNQIHSPIGTIICQIYSGIFYKETAKNFLVVGTASKISNFDEKSLLIQSLAGETEMKIIRDNANRYNFALGIKSLRNVFDALALHTPCIFLIEDIHIIGERRPLLVGDDENAKAVEHSSGTEPHDEKNLSVAKLTRHSVMHYKKPFRGDFSFLIPTNNYAFDLFLGVSSPRARQAGLTPLSPIPLVTPLGLTKDKENQTEFLSKSYLTTTSSQQANGSIVKASTLQSTMMQGGELGGSSLSLSLAKLGNRRGDSKKEKLLAPPSTAPFTVFLLKEKNKFQPKQTVKELPWIGFSEHSTLLNELPKITYSIRVKIALLAHLAVSNLSVKLNMITDLLVIIDSVRANRGFVVFATTHTPAILDPALRRPGRLDETIALPFIPRLESRWEIVKSNVVGLNFSSSFFKKVTRRVINTSCLGYSGFPLGLTVDLLDYGLFNFSFSTLHLQTYKIQENLAMFKKNHGLSPQSLLLSPSYPHLSPPSHFLPPLILGGTLRGGKRSSKPQSVQKGCLSVQKETGKALARINSEPVSQLFTPTVTTINDLLKSQGFLGLLKKKLSPKALQNIRGPKKLNNNSPSNLMAIAYSKIGNLLINTQGFALNHTNLSFFLTLHSQLENQNIPKEQASPYLHLYTTQPTPFTFPPKGGEEGASGLEQYLMGLFAAKVTETLVFSGKKRVKMAPSLLKTKVRDKARSTDNQTPIPLVGLWSLQGIDKTWRAASTLIFSLIEKRLIYKKNLIIPKLLQFYNASVQSASLNDPPSPPASFLLLPAKRYENYKRTFLAMQNKHPSHALAINEKIQFHQKRVLKQKLYSLFTAPPSEKNNYGKAINAKPWKNSQPSPLAMQSIAKGGRNGDKGEKVSDPSFTFLISPLGNKGKEQPFTPLPPPKGGESGGVGVEESEGLMLRIKNQEGFTQRVKLSIAEFIEKPTSMNWYYRNRLLNRHRGYLNNQWWNGQLYEHNVETTFLSDVDWRANFVSSFSSKKDTVNSSFKVRKNNKTTNKTNLPPFQLLGRDKGLIDKKLHLKPNDNNLKLGIQEKAIESFGDILIDFPDFDQHYNPGNRRWVLNFGYWSYWYNFQTAHNNEIYSYMVTESFLKTYHFLNSNREILDFFVTKIIKLGLLKEISIVDGLKRF